MLAYMQRTVLAGGYDAQRNNYVNKIRDVAGRNAVAMFLPHRNDTSVSIDPVSGRVWTAAVTMAGKISALGNGSQLAFDGSTMNLSTPDTANLSFPETTAPLTFFAIVNVTDTAGVRYIFAKGHTVATDLEYIWQVSATDFQLFQTNDNVAAVQATQTANAVVTQGANRSLAITYNSAGGATAANTMILYEQAVAVAETATNNAAYVQMRDLAMAGLLGARNAAGPANMFQGSMPVFLIIPAVLTAAQLVSMHIACKNYYAGGL